MGGRTVSLVRRWKWQRALKYQSDTLVTEVRLEHPELKVVIDFRDMVDFHEDLFIRRMVITNLESRDREIGYSFTMIFTLQAMILGILPIMSLNGGRFFITKANTGS